MFNFLKEILICPECHGELMWEIMNENKIHIIEAEVKCLRCNKIYEVKNGIGRFVEYENSSDGWQDDENWLNDLIGNNPDVRKKLMTTDIEEMNAADIVIRYMVHKAEGNISEAEKLIEIINKKAYKEETIKANLSQLDYIVNSLKDENDFILDVASGEGSLISKFLENTDTCLISSDISFNVLEKAKKSTEEKGFSDRVSYIAFDLNKSPFKEKTVKTITSFLGLQNIPYPEVFKEMRRICNGKLYMACVFCCEDNIVNLRALEKGGSDKTWVKNKFIDEFNKVGFTSIVENSIITLDDPTPVGEIVKGATIDGYPVETGHFERAVVISS
ncbi:MAG: methyltransferase domain-containing protein [Oscillospiraceae bacterium]|nr:methyltransferase domain-containing protein [Oscillospiraceae bacterium]